MNAQLRLTANAPAPIQDNTTALGATGSANFSQAVHRVAMPGMSRIPASAIPTRALLRAVQPRAMRIKILTEVSSRKSILSANKETDLIAVATENSTPK